ncbi:MAG: CPBP family intramembrane metalloprotease [Calditrichaeota bacterium]|nr:CPBP family intramembrane metalloprotease [Calditrichota bacterium]
MNTLSSVKNPQSAVKTRSSTPDSPWLFFALAYALSGLFWIPAGLAGKSATAFPFSLLLYSGGLGPMIADIILVRRTYTTEERRDYWRRVIDFRRIGWRWYLFILLFFPLLSISGLMIHLINGGDMPAFEKVAGFLNNPLSIIPFAVFILLFGPLPEELGWRGYALDRLQERLNALSSSLILGTFWALWHLPLFFMNGTYQHQMGLMSSAFLLYSLNMIFDSVLYTWIYNNTRRSVLSAILFHFMTNFSGELMPMPQQIEIFKLIIKIIVVGAVIYYWGYQTLSRSHSPE